MGNTFSGMYKWLNPEAYKWRTQLDWTPKNQQNLINYIDNYKPPYNLPNSNLLIVGVAGSGKSSYINTVVSAIKKEVTCCAAARGNKMTVTKRITRYTNILKNIHFCDTIGLPESHEKMEEVEKLLLEGKMPTQSKEECAKGVGEDIHAGLIVIEPVTLKNDLDMIKQNIGTIQDLFEEKEIPYFLLITKMDQSNRAYQNSLEKIFYDAEIERLVDLASVAFGVPRYRIWPVVNYEKDVVTRADIDILALTILKTVLHSAEAYIETKYNSPGNSD